MRFIPYIVGCFGAVKKNLVFESKPENFIMKQI